MLFVASLLIGSIVGVLILYTIGSYLAYRSDRVAPS